MMVQANASFDEWPIKARVKRRDTFATNSAYRDEHFYNHDLMALNITDMVALPRDWQRSRG